VPSRVQQAAEGRPFAALDEAARIRFIAAMSRRELKSWDGPAQPLVYANLRNDAVDVVYGTVDGFARVGVPYLPHILPEQRW
jgi:hypothetical protein